MPETVSGPPGKFLLGNLPEFASDVLGFFKHCARNYGDIVRIRLGIHRAYLFNHPELVEQVLVTNNRDFRKHRFFWKHVRGIFGEGLLTSEGDFWRRQRRMAQPAFHRERIAAYGNLMVQYTHEMLREWQAGEQRNIHQEMMHLTSRIVTKTLFDVEIDRSAHGVDAAFNVAIQEIAIRFRRPFRIPDFVPIPGNLRYAKSVKRLNNVIYAIIRERKQRPAGEDLLWMMLQAQDEDGSRMTDQQLRDEAVTLFLAGHETTAIALTWTFYLLSRYPDVERKLYTELEQVLNNRLPQSEDLRLLPYTESVITESMRLYPPAYAIGREALCETKVDSVAISKGTTVFISPWVIHRDPRFFDSPDEFRPDRWQGALSKMLPRFAYFPFGGGPRVCIGNSFAMMEAVLLLATISQKFRLKLKENQPVEPFPAITLRPRTEIIMTLENRK